MSTAWDATMKDVMHACVQIITSMHHISHSHFRCSIHTVPDRGTMAVACKESVGSMLLVSSVKRCSKARCRR